jgi:hypothetical protein
MKNGYRVGAYRIRPISIPSSRSGAPWLLTKLQYFKLIYMKGNNHARKMGR